MWDSVSDTTSDEIRYQAKKDLLLHDTDVWDEWIRDRIFEGCEAIGGLDTVISKDKTLCIENFRAKLPCGFIDFSQSKSVELDSGNNPIYPEYVNNIQQQRAANSLPRRSFQRIGNYLAFSTDITAAECKIFYDSVWLDDKDRPMIPGKAARCLRAYVVLQYGAINADKVSDRLFVLADRTWTNGSAEMRGWAAMLDAQKRRVMYRIMNSMM